MSNSPALGTVAVLQSAGPFWCEIIAVRIPNMNHPRIAFETKDGVVVAGSYTRRQVLTGWRTRDDQPVFALGRN